VVTEIVFISSLRVLSASAVDLSQLWLNGKTYCLSMLVSWARNSSPLPS
jgi:hypothetical protein